MISLAKNTQKKNKLFIHLKTATLYLFIFQRLTFRSVLRVSFQRIFWYLCNLSNFTCLFYLFIFFELSIFQIKPKYFTFKTTGIQYHNYIAFWNSIPQLHRILEFNTTTTSHSGIQHHNYIAFCSFNNTTCLKRMALILLQMNNKTHIETYFLRGF